jgi:hypothetical protein
MQDNTKLSSVPSNNRYWIFLMLGIIIPIPAAGLCIGILAPLMNNAGGAYLLLSAGIPLIIANIIIFFSTHKDGKRQAILKSAIFTITACAVYALAYGFVYLASSWPH